MLTFFRKYQKSFLVAIVVMTAASFLFFGTYSALSPAAEMAASPPEKVVGQAIDGTPISESLQATYLTLLSPSELQRRLGVEWANSALWLDGVLWRDLIESGLLHSFVARHWDEVEGDLTQRIEKVRHARPFVHPQLPSVQAAAVWKEWAPGLMAAWETLSQENQMGPEAWDRWVELYREQGQFSPMLTQRVLWLQMRRMGATPQQEEILLRADLALGRLHNWEEWVGQKIAHATVELLVNAGRMAAAQGCQPSWELVQRLAAEQLQERHQRASLQELFERANAAGLRPELLMAFWRDVLSLQALLEADAASELWIPAPEELLAAERLDLEIEEIAPALRSCRGDRLEGLARYLALVVPSDEVVRACESTTLPQRFRDVAELPEVLLERSFEVEVTQATLRECEQTVPLTAIRNWQLDEAHWPEMVRLAPGLKGRAAATREERYQALTALSQESQRRLERTAIEAILAADPAYITAYLAQQSPQRQLVHLRAGKMIEFPDLTPATQDLLLQALLQEGPQAAAACQELALRREGATVYSFHPLGEVGAPRLLRWEELQAQEIALPLPSEVGASQLQALLEALVDEKFLSLFEQENPNGLEWAPRRTHLSLFSDEIEGTPWEGALGQEVGTWSAPSEKEPGLWCRYRVVARTPDPERLALYQRQHETEQRRQARIQRGALLAGELGLDKEPQ